MNRDRTCSGYIIARTVSILPITGIGNLITAYIYSLASNLNPATTHIGSEPVDEPVINISKTVSQ